MTTVTIAQSCYIPWKGYFDLIQKSDIFVLYDCVQYTTYDWRNRNRFKNQHGVHWLTVPVTYVSRSQRICDTACANTTWPQLHWETIRHAYRKAPYFSQFSPHIQRLYETCNMHM